MDPVLRIIREAGIDSLEEYAQCFFPTQYDDLSPFLSTLNTADHLTCLLLFRAANRKVPRQFQLESMLATMSQHDSIIIAGTGSGKTICMILPLLLDPESISIVISPLKRLQINQVCLIFFF